MRDSFNEFGNPFSDGSSELFVLDSKVVVLADIVEWNVTNKFREDLYGNQTHWITRLNLPLFASKKKRRTKADGHVRILKLDVELFSRLFIVIVICQTRLTTPQATVSHVMV